MMGTSFFFGGGFEIVFFMMFFLIAGMIVFAAVQGLRQWNRNNRSPRLTVEAEVVTKRTEVTHRHNGSSGMGHSHSTTWYYATFQVASGDRMEFAVGGGEYGMLVEGDRGRLMFQGTRYLGFEREV